MNLSRLLHVLGVAVLAGVLLAGNVGAETTGKKTPLYIIERDTLQTRNYVPIINHQTSIINLGRKQIVLTLSSEIPQGKYRKGDGYPAFLAESLLPEPLFSPVEVTPERTSYLPAPQVITDKGRTIFSWRKVVLPPGESVVAQYDNFFGEKDVYRKKDGFDFAGVRVKTSYSAKEVLQNNYELSMIYEIENTTRNPVRDFSLSLFVPLKKIEKDRERKLFVVNKICSSPNVEVSRVTKSDGFGEAASGIAVTFITGELQVGMPVVFMLSLTGIRSAEQEGVIWPILNVTGRRYPAVIWPQTVVTSDAPFDVTRFSYISYNLAINDGNIFILKPGFVGTGKANK